MEKEYYGHSANDNGEGVPERLYDHLSHTAERAAGYAEAFGTAAAQQALMAGWLHDAGKYTEQFQERLRNPRIKGRNHWSQGALLALLEYGKRGLMPAMAIEGHHAGLGLLERTKKLCGTLCERMTANKDEFTSTDLAAIKAKLDGDGIPSSLLEQGLEDMLLNSREFSAADMLDVRMLFSTLVDADFVETEAHFAGDSNTPRKNRPEGPDLNPTKALEVLERKLEKLSQSGRADPRIQEVRSTLLADCIEAAGRPLGLFTLSAPTGSGKTLSMLAFALHHAIKHGLRRIVLVMPFLNIIEQTAQEYRDLFIAANGFPEHYVIEDHSNVATPAKRGEKTDGGGSPDSVEEVVRLKRLLAENWDAPIILTTSVQCLESLHSNRPSACRKLHRMAKSVILFDEVQTIPPELAEVTLGTLSRLAERFGSTVVFATATQPAFDELHGKVSKQCRAGWQPTEIVSDAPRLFAPSSDRVRVKWRHEEPTEWEALAEQLAESDQVMCILNLKKHARQLADSLRTGGVDGLTHLSTDMCTSHRQDVLGDVRVRLDEGRPVRLVATQCVEAGVDIDFPVVYRALAPLEAIAQAAGRCNRHGKRPTAGRVVVFRPSSDDGKYLYPGGGYKQAAESTETFLRRLADNSADLDDEEILSDPERLRRYYRQHYKVTNCCDPTKAISEGLESCDFEQVAREYRLIKQNTINILVPYDQAEFDKLRNEIEQAEPLTPKFIREWIRQARPYTVSKMIQETEDPCTSSVLTPVTEGRLGESWYICIRGEAYDSELLGFVGLEDWSVL